MRRRMMVVLLAFFFGGLLPSLRADIWIESFNGQPSGQDPNGYRYDVNSQGTTPTIYTQYDEGNTTLEWQVSINGGPFTSGFSCSDGFGGAPAECSILLPYSCGKMTVQSKRRSLSGTSFSQPVDVYLYNSLSCLPQCDSCELQENGESVGRPVNVTTGKLFYQAHDFTLSGPQPLRFERWYDNQTNYAGDLGYGWRHNYAAFLDLAQAANRLVILHDAEDRQYFFTGGLSSTPVHDALSGADLTLVGGVYTLTLWNGQKMSFDSAGRLSSITDRIGNVQAIARDASNRIDSVSDPLGRAITFLYDAQNRITSVTSSPAGVSVTFGYTGTNCPANNLCSATMPDSKTWHYEYTDTDSHNLTKVLDPLGHAEEINTYSADRAAMQTIEGGQNSLTFVYGSGATTVTDGLSRVTTYTYDPKLLRVTNVTGPGCNCRGGQSKSSTFDNFGRKSSQTDGLGSTHTITFNYGRDVEQTFPDGFHSVVTPYPSLTRRTEPLSASLVSVTNWTYYPLGDPRRDLPQTEFRKSVDTPANNATTTFTYNTQGLLTQVDRQGYVNGVSTTLTTKSTWDAKGRLLTQDGPRTDVNDTFTNTYYSDSDTDLARRGQLSSFTNAAGHVTTYAAGSAPLNTYDLFGNAKRIIDPNGVVTERMFDGRGRLQSSVVKGVAGDGADLVTSYTYDDAGFRTKVTMPRLNGTSFVYDGAKRLTNVIHFGTDGKQYEQLSYSYDVMGQKTSDSSQSCNSPAVSCSGWTTARSESFHFDAYGRVDEVTFPGGAKSIRGYDLAGNLHTVQDERHTAPNTPNIIYEYDLANRLTTVTHKQLLVVGPDVVTRYGYDPDSDLTSVTDPNLNVTIYEFDDFHRLKKQTSPVTGVTTNSFDSADNLLTTVDARGITVTRSYDVLNRVVTVTPSGATTDAVTWSYDGAASGTYGLGRVWKMADASGVTTFGYDRRGLLRTETRVQHGSAMKTSYAYDENSNVAMLTYPSGQSVVYTYNYADKPVSAVRPAFGSVPGATYVSNVLYRPFGPHYQMTFGNNTQREIVHTQRYAVDDLGLRDTTNSSWMAHYDYTPDASSNVGSINDLLDVTWNRSFGYDDLNRLTTANTGTNLWGTGLFEYDSMGTLKKMTLGSTVRQINTAATSKLTSVVLGGVTYPITLNALGSEVQSATASYGWSARNLLELSTRSGAAYFYEYDGTGLRRASGEVPAAGPLVTAVSPSRGSGGLLITMTGYRLGNGATTVTVGGVAATGVGVSGNTITATTPGLSPGTLNDIVVTDSSGSVTFTKAFQSLFSDVPSTNTFVSHVETLFRNSVTTGCGGGAFCVNNNTSNAEMALFLMRAIRGPGYVQTVPATAPYADVPTTHFFAGSISDLKALNIAEPCGTNLYCPDSPVTRRKMAALLLRALEGATWAPPAATGIFTDVAANSQFAGYIEELKRRAITNGCEPTGQMYCPDNYVLRGQMAAFLVRTWNMANAQRVGSLRRDKYYSTSRQLLSESEYSSAARPNIMDEYIWLGGMPVATVQALTGMTRWIFADHLGTPLILTNADRSIYWRAEYEPFGNIRTMRSANNYQPLRLPGQEAEQYTAPFDANGTGDDLSYNVYRWYRGAWGRYTQSDPVDPRSPLAQIQDRDGRAIGIVYSDAILGTHDTEYSYANDNPVNFFDPSGNWPVRLLGPNKAYDKVGEGRICGVVIGDEDPLTLHLDYEEYRRGRGPELHLNVVRRSNPDGNKHIPLDWLRKLVKSCPFCTPGTPGVPGPPYPIFVNPCAIIPGNCGKPWEQGPA